MQEATRKQEAFAHDKATDHDRAGIVFVPGKEYVFVVGEYAVPGKVDEYRREAVWLVMPEGQHVGATVEYDSFVTGQHRIAVALEAAETVAGAEPVMCRAHPETPAVNAAGFCETCVERNYEAAEVIAAERGETNASR